MVSYSYCFSDSLVGRTNNAAVDGYNWIMTEVLPYTTGLNIDGVTYRYSIDKQPEDDATVYIRNPDTEVEGYVYEREDVWDGLPGNTKVGYDPLIATTASRFGDGEIGIDGVGTLSDVSIFYHYSYDTCTVPLTSPSCPGYLDALYKYLLDNGLLDGSNKDDPYYNEWVQAQLNLEAEVEEQEFSEAPEEDESRDEVDMEAALSISGAAEKIADVAMQEQMLQSLANMAALNPYYEVAIDGGVYEETIQLEDAEIQDNRRALRSLASDSLHREMVKSQYD